jgi:hypothetical protein
VIFIEKLHGTRAVVAILPRVCLKSVSADYLTRKGGTEFN